MNLIEKLLPAYQQVRAELFTEREPSGHWIGELSTSALSTATAISALSLVERHSYNSDDPWLGGGLGDEILQQQISKLIIDGLHWLSNHQNEDGGWGDTQKSYSNIATTMLVRAAFHLTGVPAEHADLMQRAEAYINQVGGIAALRRRFGKDKTFAAPILANCALAELVPWSEVSSLPFELACVPQSFYRLMRMPVVSYAIPALVAIGQVKYFHRKPLNPVTRWIRKKTAAKSLEVLVRMQPESGGYLEAVPLTSFVVMSLASIGQVHHRVTRQGVKFLIASVRSDGSWPIDTNLATWNTTLAMNALSGVDESDPDELFFQEESELQQQRLQWLLKCQQQEVHPFTAAEPGGWAWTDLSGGVPDVDDTAGALLALRNEYDKSTEQTKQHVKQEETLSRAATIRTSALDGILWLLNQQNRDGGWPTFCRGWGKLPFDRSGCDLTAHALRALVAWRWKFQMPQIDLRIEQAIFKGLKFLTNRQAADGSWPALWFGNQDHPQEENPIYGTARVIMAYQELDLLESPVAQKGLSYLCQSQNGDGGWGSAAKMDQNPDQSIISSVEETAVVVDALCRSKVSVQSQDVIIKGLTWVVRAVEENRFQITAPIGFYFAKLWYHERLYPTIFTLSALSQAIQVFQSQSAASPTPAHHE